MTNITIITGGQTGVDRAALDFAMAKGLKCSGFIPPGRKAEDGRLNNKYPLTELKSGSYSDRTKKNIELSDASLILHLGKLDEGTLLTKNHCIEKNKPCIEINMKTSPGKSVQITNWCLSNNISKLNIAGPRESNAPGIYQDTLFF